MHKNIRKVIVGVGYLLLVGTMPIYAQKVCIGEKQVEVGKIELVENSWHYIELGNMPHLIPGCKGYYISKDHQVIRVTDGYNSIDFCVPSENTSVNKEQTALEAQIKGRKVYVPLEPIAGKMGYEVTTDGGKVILTRQSGDNVLIINGRPISEGIYRTYLLVYEEMFDASNHSEEEVKKREQLIKEDTLEALKRMIVVEQMSEEKDVMLSKETVEEINSSLIWLQGGYVNHYLVQQGFNANHIRDRQRVEELEKTLLMALGEECELSKEAIKQKKTEVATWQEQMLCKEYSMWCPSEDSKKRELAAYYMEQILKQALRHQAMPYRKELSEIEEAVIELWYQINVEANGETKELQDELIQATIAFDETGDRVVTGYEYLKYYFTDEEITKLKEMPLHTIYPSVITNEMGEYIILQIEEFKEVEEEEAEERAIMILKRDFAYEKIMEKVQQCRVEKLAAYDSIQPRTADEDYDWQEIDDTLIDDSEIFTWQEYEG